MGEKRRYTLLIVDDELIISDGLKDLLEEKFSDTFQVYNCYHPQKALEIFKYRLPEVVVSDIKMPKMTGIEMAEKMREIKPDIHVLFLSGYDEFDYVYSAMKQDADDYILKTEGDSIIVNALQKMVKRLDLENVFMEEYICAQSKISYMAPAFNQQALIYILDGAITTEEEFKDVMADLENPLLADGKMLMVIGCLKERVSLSVQEKILETGNQLLGKVWGMKIGHIHKVMYHNYFVWMLETEDAKLPSLLFVTVLDIQKMIQVSLKMMLYFGIAGESVSWRELHNKYNDLWTEMQQQDMNEENSIILENKELNISASFNEGESYFEHMFVPIKEEIQVMNEFLVGENFSEFHAALDNILNILGKAQRHSMYALEIYYSIGNMLIAYINKKNLRMELASGIRLMELFDPGSFETWEQATEYIRKLTAEIEKVCENSNQNRMVSITDKTKAYILSHLADDLSLTVIGQIIGFNPVYLSRVFKQFEKISIRDYIEKCRMDMAMSLIQNSRMKIYEVAEKCGYQNTAYFIKIFKVHYEMTPQECRDSYK
jgi:two-component system response regulator YesN